MAQIQLVITMDQATNRMSLSGPIQDKLLAYGMLELAKDALREYNHDKRIEVPQLVVPGLQS
jgi:hypothetical protein